MVMKDYCSYFPEYWRKIYIGDCCKIHDDSCGTHSFFNCLKTKITRVESFIITIGGAIGCWFIQPTRMWNRI